MNWFVSQRDNGDPESAQDASTGPVQQKKEWRTSLQELMVALLSRISNSTSRNMVEGRSRKAGQSGTLRVGN